ncbi:uncharacterized protein LOC124326623 [Daphnia pulicaria]|uniref:uncharacterized protein LOC124326623 n=1 Tax=Daphnia pulicaria TaxID=35523 RepID=UPI001EEBA995|nr:uncharacterized protein LOC124326623 [Daphnia pulicaria]
MFQISPIDNGVGRIIFKIFLLTGSILSAAKGLVMKQKKQCNFTISSVSKCLILNNRSRTRCLGSRFIHRRLLSILNSTFKGDDVFQIEQVVESIAVKGIERNSASVLQLHSSFTSVEPLSLLPYVRNFWLPITDVSSESFCH